MDLKAIPGALKKTQSGKLPFELNFYSDAFEFGAELENTTFLKLSFIATFLFINYKNLIIM